MSSCEAVVCGEFPKDGAWEIFSKMITRLEERRTSDATARKKSNLAQKRWKILARALTGSPELVNTEPEDESSVRRFTSFNLLNTVRLENTVADPASTWYEYSAMLGNELHEVQIRHVARSFTANELIGFNNTGNVCVWPSEECLAYYLLRNKDICRDKRILELGGGMSCLAGVITAKYCGPSAVTLTDGNATSVDNVRCIVNRNSLSPLVECGVVQWARAARAARIISQPETNGNRFKTSWLNESNDISRIPGKLYDVILCADCLFFDEARLDLVETIYGWLAQDGLALVMAPKRGSTFQKFAEAAIRRGFIARQIDRYDAKVWSRHLELLEHGQEYCSDLHYPLLLELTKQKKTSPG